jgi:hypothetical protein
MPFALRLKAFEVGLLPVEKCVVVSSQGMIGTRGRRVLLGRTRDKEGKQHDTHHAATRCLYNPLPAHTILYNARAHAFIVLNELFELSASSFSPFYILFPPRSILKTQLAIAGTQAAIVGMQTAFVETQLAF